MKNKPPPHYIVNTPTARLQLKNNKLKDMYKHLVSSLDRKQTNCLFSYLFLAFPLPYILFSLCRWNKGRFDCWGRR